MAEKWEDRSIEDNKIASSPETEIYGPTEHDPLAEAFKAEGHTLFGSSSPLPPASSTESDDRKPAARERVDHVFDDALDTTYFDIEEPPDHHSKRPRISQEDNVARMPSLGGMARADNVVRLPNMEYPLPPGQMHMSLNMPYQVASPQPLAHHHSHHATHNPYSNPSPGYVSYLHDSSSHHASAPLHDSPHRLAYPSHHYPSQHNLLHPAYYGHPMVHPRHELGSPMESRAQTTTSTGENPREFRRGPTQEELESAKTARARAALMTWYQRLEDLYRYKLSTGHCNVPQKYEELPELGIWVNKQRMEKKARDEGKKNSMTVHKIAALNALGFQWAKRKGQAAWNEKYEELEAYLRQYGDCMVPTKYPENPALGRWVSTQRSNYKEYEKGDKTKMTDERKELLDRLGFRWTMMNT